MPRVSCLRVHASSGDESLFRVCVSLSNIHAAMLPIKTGISSAPSSRMCPGARRSFFCRMKCKSMPKVKEEADTTTGLAQKKRKNSSEKKYCVIHCMGYLKSWTSAASKHSDEGESEGDSSNFSCLVAVGRTVAQFNPPTPVSKLNIPLRSPDFTSRHTMDGKFVFVDQRATLILGYLPQELLDTSCYEYCHPDDIKSLAESHRNGELMEFHLR